MQQELDPSCHSLDEDDVYVLIGRCRDWGRRQLGRLYDGQISRCVWTSAGVVWSLRTPCWSNKPGTSLTGHSRDGRWCSERGVVGCWGRCWVLRESSRVQRCWVLTVTESLGIEESVGCWGSHWVLGESMGVEGSVGCGDSHWVLGESMGVEGSVGCWDSPSGCRERCWVLGGSLGVKRISGFWESRLVLRQSLGVERVVGCWERCWALREMLNV